MGVTRGLLVGLENVRQRRYKEAQDVIAEKERTRRHQREDYDFARARKLDTREDEDYVEGEADEDYARERGRVLDTREDEDYEHRLQRRPVLEGREDDEYEHDVSRRRTLEGREDTEYDQGQEDRGMRLQALAQEGLRDFVQTLQNGGDPSYALSRFNRQGQLKIDPTTFQYDEKTGNVSFTDSNGDKFQGTLDQLGRAMGLVPEKKDPIKLGKSDRLIDPDTHETLVDALPDEGSADGSSGAGGRRRTSPYNPESAQQNIARDLVLSRSGQMDVLGNWSVADPADRQIVNYMISLGHDMEGRLRDAVSSGAVTPGEISNAVVDAVRDMPSDTELQKKADTWRVTGVNKTEERARAWLETERARVRAEVEGRLARAEQRLLGKAAQAEGDVAAQIPDAAKQAIDQAMNGGKTQVRFRNGQVWTKRGDEYVRLE